MLHRSNSLGQVFEPERGKHAQARLPSRTHGLQYPVRGSPLTLIDCSIRIVSFNVFPLDVFFRRRHLKLYYNHNHNLGGLLPLPQTPPAGLRSLGKAISIHPNNVNLFNNFDLSNNFGLSNNFCLSNEFRIIQ